MTKVVGDDKLWFRYFLRDQGYGRKAGLWDNALDEVRLAGTVQYWPIQFTVYCRGVTPGDVIRVGTLHIFLSVSCGGVQDSR